MTTTSPSPRRRRLLALASAGIVLTTLAGAGIYGLLVSTGEDPDRAPAVVPTRTGTASPGGEEVLSWQDLPALPHTGDPISYARAVAAAVFTWDTMSGLSPDDYANPVLVDADPSGGETSGLISDLEDYLPSDEVWLQLRDYQTTQTLTIDKAYVPDTWVEISRANPARLGEGVVAVTIDGTRRREGVWLGQHQTSTHPVAFTVILTCRPSYDRCHTLRLSRPGSALR